MSTRVSVAIDPPSITILSPIEQSKLYFNDDTGFRDVEITPWALENKKLGGNYLYLVSSYNTHICDDDNNILLTDVYTKISNCKLRQSSANTPSNTTLADGTKSLWSRDYYGAFSGHIIGTKNQGFQIYTINHGELLNNNYFSALPERCKIAPDIGYGLYPCTVENHTLSYNAFVGMSSFAWNTNNFYSDNNFIDQGPIVWPGNGYVDKIKKATVLGILHPTSIIKDGYIYVFFRDTSQGNEAGRMSGMKVARAPITDSGIDPISFKTYFQTDFIDSALPLGFDKEKIEDYFSQKGGRSSGLFNADNRTDYIPDVYSFSVAHLMGTNWYLGVAQDLYLGVTLRLSMDLVNWSQQIVVPGTEFNYFKDGGTPEFIKQPFMYPRLASIDGDSNNEIDPNNFFIIGTSDGKNPFNSQYKAKIVNKINLKLNLVKSGDYDNDQKVDLVDFGLWKVEYLTGRSSLVEFGVWKTAYLTK